MTPRQRVEIALRGGHADRIPFTMYESKVPRCAAERALRNRGMCIVDRTVNVFRTHRPNVKVHEKVSWAGGKRNVRVVYETPLGPLTSAYEDAGFTSWVHERPFKCPDDFARIRFFLQDEQYEPNYQAFQDHQDHCGEDVILRAGFGLEPLQELISGSLMHMETFAEQWMDHRDEMLELYDILVNNRRKVYPLVAQSPALIANYGGNVVVEMIGAECFEDYYVPHYNEAAEIMHRHGKLVGCHFDDDCRLLANAINTTDLDYIEAFSPAPDSDMTLAQARAAWPDKIIWINFPSSQHSQSDDRVEQIAFDLAEQAGSPDGVLMGLTEDVPAHRWQHSCRAIMDGLGRHAAERPNWYD